MALRFRLGWATEQGSHDRASDDTGQNAEQNQSSEHRGRRDELPDCCLRHHVAIAIVVIMTIAYHIAPKIDENEMSSTPSSL
jgi:hypothetical protein